MTHYTIGFVTPTSTDWIERYTTSVGPIVARHGGAYAVRTAGHERLEGDIDVALVVVIEWPSKEAETAFFADPEYAPHRADRQAGSMTTLYSVPRQDDLA